MGFLAPWNLLWLGLLVPLILLYVLKRRREEVRIGSVLLWQAALRDMRAERPFRRLLPHLSLLLQALVIICGAVALARPVLGETLASGARLCVVVDTSASMGATDRGVARIDWVRERIHALVDSLPPGGRMMIVDAGETPEVRTGFERNDVALGRAIDGLRVRGGRSDLGGALGVAAERMQDAGIGSRIIVFSDGAMDGVLPTAGRVPTEFIFVGEEDASNAAIVDADVRLLPGERDRAHIFARIFYQGPSAVEVFVTAHDARTERLLTSRRVQLEPGESTGAVLRADLPPSARGQTPIVRLALGGPEAAWTDALSLDDAVFLPSPGGRRLPVVMVGSASAPVLRVLRSDPQVELFSTTAEELAEEPLAEPSLLVFFGDVPADAPPGDSWVIAPTGERAFEFDLGEEVAAPRIATWREDDARLRFLRLDDVTLGRARSAEGGEGLIRALHGTVASTIVRTTGETTLLAFDPADGTWPRDASFVVFFRNLLERARQRRAEGGIPAGTLGEALRVLAPGDPEVSVVAPSGETLSAQATGGLAVVPVSAEPGVYVANVAGRELVGLRSLLDESESDLARRLEVQSSEGALTTAEASETDSVAQTQWIFILLLLLFFCGELFWATRKGALVR